MMQKGDVGEQALKFLKRYEKKDFPYFSKLVETSLNAITSNAVAERGFSEFGPFIQQNRASVGIENADNRMFVSQHGKVFPEDAFKSLQQQNGCPTQTL